MWTRGRRPWPSGKDHNATIAAEGANDKLPHPALWAESPKQRRVVPQLLYNRRIDSGNGQNDYGWVLAVFDGLGVLSWAST